MPDEKNHVVEWILVVECHKHPDPCSTVMGRWIVNTTDPWGLKKSLIVSGDCKGRPFLPLQVLRVEEED